MALRHIFTEFNMVITDFLLSFGAAAASTGARTAPATADVAQLVYLSSQRLDHTAQLVDLALVIGCRGCGDGHR